jgi:NRAMP (natural resistance-associated macrophage protein)-like metal ion transporter
VPTVRRLVPGDGEHGGPVTPGRRQRTPPAPDGPSADARRPSGRIRRLYLLLGPGFVTGASDDDPSGIGTYSVAGASFGFATLWVAWVTFPLMTAIQYMCAKMGMVTGMGLAGVLRRHTPRWVLYPMIGGLVVANTINAGVDIGAIAAAVNLLAPGLPIMGLVVPIALSILALQIYGAYRLIANVLKALALSLLAYVASSFFAKPDWWEVARGTFVPTVSLDATFLAMLVAILGTTISPYLFFWQADHEVEEEIAHGRTRLAERRGATDAELKVAKIDVGLGMFFSNAVMYFIILATAATLFQAGRTDINSATDAAEALRPLAGDAAGLLLAVGLVGTGLLAVPILTASAAYAVCQAAGWTCGLSKRWREARRFYGLIVVCTLVGMGVNFVGVNPIDALFWTAVVNGFLAPPMLVVIMRLANDRSVMGDRVNGVWLNLLGWTTTVLMFGAAIALVLTWGKG